MNRFLTSSIKDVFEKISGNGMWLCNKIAEIIVWNLKFLLVFFLKSFIKKKQKKLPQTWDQRAGPFEIVQTAETEA